MERIKALAKSFCEGEYDHNVEDDVWHNVFEYLYENADTLIFKKHLIHTLWTVNGGHLRRKISNDDLVLSVLLKSLPTYSGEGLVLYRGECKFLYDENKIGFCWTPKEKVAEMFAGGLNAIESGGVLLKVYAHRNAIISSPNSHSAKQMREFEYTCNPKLLENIQVINTFNKI